MAIDKKACTSNTIDEGVREQQKNQTLMSDIMYVMRNTYLVSVAEPLELIITASAKQFDVKTLGIALMSHINLLESHEFCVFRVITDVQQGLVALQGKLGRVEVKIVGAVGYL